MGVVHQQPGAVVAGRGGEPGERCRVAVHREDRVADHHGGPGVPGERLADGVGVGVRHDLGAGPGQPAAVDQRGVVGGVGDQQRARRGEGGDRCEVGGVAGGQHQRGFEAGEAGQLRFEFRVQLGAAGDQPGPGGAGAPAQASVRAGPGDLRMPAQSEVVVAREVQQRRLLRPGPQFAVQPGGGADGELHRDPAEGTVRRGVRCAVPAVPGGRGGRAAGGPTASTCNVLACNRAQGVVMHTPGATRVVRSVIGCGPSGRRGSPHGSADRTGGQGAATRAAQP